MYVDGNGEGTTGIRKAKGEVRREIQPHMSCGLERNGYSRIERPHLYPFVVLEGIHPRHDDLYRPPLPRWTRHRFDVDAALFEHRGRVEPERLPGQLQVTTKLPFRDDELADDVLASLAIFPAENYGVRLDRFKAVKTKNHVLNDQY